jgi:hypothetical protein
MGTPMRLPMSTVTPVCKMPHHDGGSLCREVPCRGSCDVMKFLVCQEISSCACTALIVLTLFLAACHWIEYPARTAMCGITDPKLALCMSSCEL